MITIETVRTARRIAAAHSHLWADSPAVDELIEVWGNRLPSDWREKIEIAVEPQEFGFGGIFAPAEHLGGIEHVTSSGRLWWRCDDTHVTLELRRPATVVFAELVEAEGLSAELLAAMRAHRGGHFVAARVTLPLAATSLTIEADHISGRPIPSRPDHWDALALALRAVCGDAAKALAATVAADISGARSAAEAAQTGLALALAR